MSSVPLFVVTPSVSAQVTKNPIRAIVDTMTLPPNPDFPVIPLSIGDPTVFGNLRVNDVVVSAVVEAVTSGNFNGYPHSAGTATARKAVADKYSLPGRPPLTVDDVILGSGCSGALEIVISTLINEGDNILVPRPGFPLYATLCTARGGCVKHYDLVPSRNWEADLDMMAAMIDSRTRGIVVNNPSNPCGCVYSEQHLRDILALAYKRKVPIIADEIYANMVFESAEYTPLASLGTKVPILSVGGIAKQYLVPGWRLGWVLIYDNDENALKASGFVRGLLALTQLILGPNSLIQAALPRILSTTPKSYYAALNKTLELQASVVCERLNGVRGLSVVQPQGAMYVMVKLDPTQFRDIADDVVFADKLYGERSVQILPGQVFQLRNFFRIVFCASTEKITQAMDRIRDFCSVHYK